MALFVRGFLSRYKIQVTPFLFRSVSSVYHAGVKMTSSSRLMPEITKSHRDLREYRGLELQNMMKVLLISDPTTDISAAGLSVAAGSMLDPKELPGLAHFCEHMLFLGTKKFPSENEYSRYLSEHGGCSNAYTAQDHTCYYFDVAPDALNGALLRFAQFFISPLFTPSMTEREVNAVNSEHEKNIPNDNWRMHQLEVSLANPTHPFCSFATGNRDTLWSIPHEKSTDVRGSLMHYYKSYYSANLMNLIVLGKESLDELQVMAENMFSSVVNYSREVPKWPENPYGPNQVQYRVDSVPVKDIRHLKLLFPVIDTSEQYKCLSDGYLSHLIGHEGPGSLLSLLKKKSFVNNLVAGGTVMARGNAVFKIDMELSPEGLENVDVILLHIFQYLEMLRKAGPKEWIWEETVDLSKIMFEYQDKVRPQVYVSGLSSELHRLKMGDILSHGLYEAQYKPELITTVLEMMIPENCLFFVTAKECDSEDHLKEPYYGIKYSKKKIDPELIKKWKECGLHSELKLPEPNSYIPKALDLKPRDENTGIIPRLLKDNSLSRVWFLQDNEFHLPKGVFRVEVYSPITNMTPHNQNLNSMFVSAVKDRLTEEVYAAALADLHFVITPTVYGVELILKGYNDKIPSLLEIALKKITKFTLTQERFDVLKDYMVRGLNNWADEQPYLHALFYLDYLLHSRKFSAAERLERVDELTLENLKDYVEKFLANLKFEILVCGNFTAEDSIDLVNTFENFFVENGTEPILASDIVRLRELKLPNKGNYVLKTNHRSSVSSCVVVCFQTGVQTSRENIIVELIESIANEPCYNQLRTEEQLGYIVSSQVRRSHGTQGLNVLVQSNFHPSHVDMRIHAFLEKFKESLSEMTEELFQQHVSSLIVKKSEKPKKITERSVRIWSEIVSQQYKFDRQAIEVAELEKITMPEVIEYFNKRIASYGDERKRVGVHVVSETGTYDPVIVESTDHVGLATQFTLPEVSAWKEKFELYPAVDLSVTLPKSKL